MASLGRVQSPRIRTMPGPASFALTGSRSSTSFSSASAASWKVTTAVRGQPACAKSSATAAASPGTMAWRSQHRMRIPAPGAHSRPRSSAGATISRSSAWRRRRVSRVSISAMIEISRTAPASS